MKKFYFNPIKKRKDHAKEAEKIRLNKLKHETRGNKVQQTKGFN